MLSEVRKELNKWLRKACQDLRGDVLSIGSEKDEDKEGNHYKDYFINADKYYTSDSNKGHKCDFVLDVTDMKEIKNDKFDCVFCNSVLEHVFDIWKGVKEIERILKPGGILILGLPLKQAIHMPPHDYWRFTKFGINELLKDSFQIIELGEMVKGKNSDFPVGYMVKARKL